MRMANTCIGSCTCIGRCSLGPMFIGHAHASGHTTCAITWQRGFCGVFVLLWCSCCHFCALQFVLFSLVCTYAVCYGSWEADSLTITYIIRQTGRQADRQTSKQLLVVRHFFQAGRHIYTHTIILTDISTAISPYRGKKPHMCAGLLQRNVGPGGSSVHRPIATSAGLLA